MVLVMRQRLGDIVGLKVHPRWPITIGGVKVFSVEYDFIYTTVRGERHGLIIEDVKASANEKSLDPVWKLKRKVFEAKSGIVVQIVTKVEQA